MLAQHSMIGRLTNFSCCSNRVLRLESTGFEACLMQGYMRVLLHGLHLLWLSPPGYNAGFGQIGP